MTRVVFNLIFVFIGISVINNARAQEIIDEGTCGTNLTWVLTNDSVLTISGSGEMDDYPDFGDRPWNAIDTKIKTIIIADGVSTIGQNAFAYCFNLISTDIPDSVEKIGKKAFFNCTNLISVEIPSAISVIEDLTFSECSSLASIKIPDAVVTIAEGAFSFCRSLTSVEISNSVEFIGNQAFAFCNIASAEIPSAVNYIGSNVFAGCLDLTTINVDINNPIYSSRDGLLYSKLQDILICCPCGQTGAIVIPNSVNTIGEFAFSGCSKLTSIVIPNTVNTIGEGAFYGCNGLLSIKIPNTVNSISAKTFAHCSGLTEIELPNTINAIKTEAFSNCHSLTSIEIPDAVNTIGRYAFCDCRSLETIKIPNTTVIDWGVFLRCNSLKSIVVPNAVTTIKFLAFSGCSGLNTIEIQDNVSTIENYAFENCRNVNTIISHAVAPPTVYGSTFLNVPVTAHVIVPCSSVVAYQTTVYWRDFTYFGPCVGGISETIQNKKNNIYPNPVKDKFFIECEESYHTVKLYDVLGKNVLSQTANGKTEINISHLPKGIYSVHILFDGKVIESSKVVKL